MQVWNLNQLCANHIFDYEEYFIDQDKEKSKSRQVFSQNAPF